MGMVLLKLVVFAFGLCVGSFLNVVVYRLNHNLSPFQGRSFCPKCRKKIFWYDNLPLFSFLLLRGKCRFCRSPISRQYPLVELATGILFLWIVNRTLHLTRFDFSWIETGYLLFITSVLVAVFASDLRYQTIPNEIIYPTVLISLLYVICQKPAAILSGIGAGLFFLGLVLVTRGKGMGLGDVRLAVLMGLILGFPKIIVALIVAFLTGALVGVILILVGKKRFGEHIPFGPFLTVSTWISLFWGQMIWQFYVERVLA